MANRTPLVLVNGTLRELPNGDLIDPAKFGGIKTLNGISLIGTGDVVIDIPVALDGGSATSIYTTGSLAIDCGGAA